MVSDSTESWPTELLAVRERNSVYLDDLNVSKQIKWSNV